jgi:orotate phosphoribosyltransferase
MSEDSTRPAGMSQDSVMAVFEETGALLRGHFLLTSGLHSPNYLQCAKVLQHTGHAETLGRALADRFRGNGVDVVVAPAIGGIVIGHEVARALGVRSIFTEREGGAMRLRRGFEIAGGERVLVVEDVITTGGSTRETIDAVRASGGEVIGAGSIIDRSGGAADVGVPRAALATLSVVTHEPGDCPLCREGTAAVKPGSRS